MYKDKNYKEINMNKNNAAIAEAYYTGMGEKNISVIEKYLHSDVQFVTPLGSTQGKEALLEAARKFTSFFKSLKIRAKFGSEDQAMIVYDVEFPAPVGKTPTAALMTFREGLISKIELIYDARPLEAKKDVFK
jgi:hypothetical protein